MARRFAAILQPELWRGTERVRMPRASDSSGRFTSTRPEKGPNQTHLQSGGTEDLAHALERLRDDGCVAFPTETVWGLAARALSRRAVERLCAWKGRGEDQPISLLVAGAEGLEEMGFQLSAEACGLMDEFWPGPLTLVLPCTHVFPRGIARGDGAVGLRCSPHPVAAELSQAAYEAGLGPLTATSLNRSGEPPARSETEARDLCGSDPEAPYVLRPRGPAIEEGSPSTVLDLSGATPEVLRIGAIPVEKIYSSQALKVFASRDVSPSGEEQE